MNKEMSLRDETPSHFLRCDQADANNALRPHTQPCPLICAQSIHRTTDVCAHPRRWISTALAQLYWVSCLLHCTDMKNVFDHRSHRGDSSASQIGSLRHYTPSIQSLKKQSKHKKRTTVLPRRVLPRTRICHT